MYFVFNRPDGYIGIIESDSTGDRRIDIDGNFVDDARTSDYFDIVFETNDFSAAQWEVFTLEHHAITNIYESDCN